MTNPERKAAVIEQVRRAFAGVTLEDGIGLKEGQAIDDYADKWVCENARKEDEKSDWQLLLPPELARCHSSLSFFDPKGMRFHLPAFLIAELEGRMHMGTEFHLVHLDDFAKSKFSLLSPEQREAVSACLWLMLDDKRYEFEHENIARALEEYWERSDSSLPS